MSFKIVEREIIFDDEWEYDSQNQLFISSSGEIWTEDQFEKYITN